MDANYLLAKHLALQTKSDLVEHTISLMDEKFVLRTNTEMHSLEHLEALTDTFYTSQGFQSLPFENHEALGSLLTKDRSILAYSKPKENLSLQVTLSRHPEGHSLQGIVADNSAMLY